MGFELHEPELSTRDSYSTSAPLAEQLASIDKVGLLKLNLCADDVLTIKNACNQITCWSHAVNVALVFGQL